MLQILTTQSNAFTVSQQSALFKSLGSIECVKCIPSFIEHLEGQVLCLTYLVIICLLLFTYDSLHIFAMHCG